MLTSLMGRGDLACIQAADWDRIVVDPAMSWK